MADQKPTRTPPAVGRAATVKVTAELYDDLAVLLSTGTTVTDAIRQAVRQAADVHRTAWAYGVCPPGTAPIIEAYSLTPSAVWTPPTSSVIPAGAPHPLGVRPQRPLPPRPTNG